MQNVFCSVLTEFGSVRRISFPGGLQPTAWEDGLWRCDGDTEALSDTSAPPMNLHANSHIAIERLLEVIRTVFRFPYNFFT